jgi:hypothetical protein
MYRLLSITLIFFITRALCALDIDSARAERGKLRIQLKADGSWGMPALSYDKNIVGPLLERLGVWITGRDMSGQLVGGVFDVFTGEIEFWPGPGGLLGGAPGDPAEFNRVHLIHTEEIDRHRRSWRDAGYQVPDALRFWPANGPKGFDPVLAPYVDYNANGKYDPEYGDYPYVPSGTVLYTISNDLLGNHTLSGGVKSGIECQQLVWIPELTGDTLADHVVYLRFTLHNRSLQNYQGVNLALAGAFSIGDPGDDYLFTDVANNAICVYNGANTDIIYGTQAPALSIYFLNKTLAASMYFENTGDAVKGRPEEMRHFHHLARGRWKTGKPLAYGRAGLDGSIETSYVYSNGTDPLNPGVWNEEEAGNFPGKRFALMACDSFRMDAGSSVIIEAALGVIPDAGHEAQAIAQQLHKQKMAMANQMSSALSFAEPDGMRFVQRGNQLVLISKKSYPVKVHCWDMTGRQLAHFQLAGTNSIDLNNIPGLGPFVFTAYAANGLVCREKIFKTYNH